MKADFKKRVKELREKLSGLRAEFEDLRAEHEEWMNDHDYDWENTTAGERASDDQYNLQDAVDTLETLESDMDDNFEL